VQAKNFAVNKELMGTANKKGLPEKAARNTLLVNFL
jgi:hypothetical protein